MKLSISAAAIQRWAPLMVLLGLCLVLTLVNPNFLSLRNFARLSTASAAPLMLAIGVTFIIIMGSIDLSMEGVMAFCGAALAMILAQFGSVAGWGWLAIPLSILAGVGIGMITGWIHVRMKIPTLLASLSIGFICLGLTMLITGGERIAANDNVFRMLMSERVLGFPLMVHLAGVALLIAWFIQRHTSLGRNLYAIGGGEALAHASGVKVQRIRIIAFALAGAFYALGAIFAVARLGSVSSAIGSGYMFVSITSVVVGGTALLGGNGGVWQTLVGVLIVAVISNGMVLVGLPSHLQDGVLGLMVIIAVGLTVSRHQLAIVK